MLVHFGVVRSRRASANGCGIELCVRPGECLICQSIPWTRCMHVGAVSTINYYVRNHLLSENDARGVICQAHVKHVVFVIVYRVAPCTL